MVKTRKRARIRVPLKTYYQNWKVDLGSETVTVDLMSLNCTSRSLRYGIGSFTFLLWNDFKEYNKKAKVGTDVTFYFQHFKNTPTAPTNVLFTGKIDKPRHGMNSNNLNYMIISGRDFPELVDKKITISFNNAQANNAIKLVIDTWFSGKFTYDNLHNDMTGIVNGDYTDQKAITVISDILNQVEYDGYIDSDRDIHTAPDDGTNRNETESIVHGNNMLPFSGFGRDGTKEANEVKCYGDQSEDMMLMRRKIDQKSINESWIKTKIVNARSLLTPEGVASRASAELTDSVRSNVSGFLSAEAGHPTLKPTQYFWCSHQNADIKDYYKPIMINHSLDSRGRTTANVGIEKPVKSAVGMIRELENSDNASNKNPNNMHDTMIYIKFDDETGITSLGDLEIVNGRLRIKSGKTTGTMTTEVETADSNGAHFEARGSVNDDCNLSTFKVSSDGGATYNDSDKDYNLVGDRNSAIAFTKVGKKIRATITLTEDSDNPVPELEGFSLLIRR